MSVDILPIYGIINVRNLATGFSEVAFFFAVRWIMLKVLLQMLPFETCAQNLEKKLFERRRFSFTRVNLH